MPGLLDPQNQQPAERRQGRIRANAPTPTPRGLLDPEVLHELGEGNPSPGSIGWRLLKHYMPQQLEAAKATVGGLLAPAQRLFGNGGQEFWNGPQDPQAASDMRSLLLTTGAGASALPRPVGSLGAFGKLATAEELATRGRYANPRKPSDWGGAGLLSQARTAERHGESAENVWERFGWARQGEEGTPTFNQEAATKYGIRPGEWYMEHGSSPKQLGDRYALQIGERRRTAPWRSLLDPPEAAFEAETRYDPSLLDVRQAKAGTGFKQQQAISAEEGSASPANELATKLRAAEDDLRSKGLSDAQIATRLDSQFGTSTVPDDLRTGRVWWRVTDKDAPVGKGGWQRPQWSDEVVSRLKDKDISVMSPADGAEVLTRQFGYNYTKWAVANKRKALGLSGQPGRGGAYNVLSSALGTRFEALFKKGLSYADIASKASSEFDREITKKSVENYLLRRGIKRNN